MRFRFHLALVSLLLWTAPALADNWPQEITAPEGTIVVYQPQPEKLEGNVLTSRAAVSLELRDHPEPIFGAMWLTAHIETDMDARTALIRDVRVTNVKWPDATDAGRQRFTEIVEASVPETGFEISLDRLSASLESAEREQRGLAQIKSDPPVIVFRDQLTVLVLYDGEPRFSPVENTDYERVLNVPVAVVRNKKTGVCYLTNGSLWYESKDPKGPWAPATKPPADLKQMIPPLDDAPPPPEVPPAIYVATTATEVICTDGAPDWKPLAGGELLYVQNTETPWLREVAANQMYVLISGRWFRATSQDGPWTFVRPDELPASFQKISPESDIGGVRTSIAGTEEAEEAMLDAAIPQTSTIQRSEAKLTVDYDGDPKFEPIEGTNISYAVNTGAQVLLISGKYYALDSAVWFVSDSPKGPWVAADSVPKEEIQQIPPSSPVYNVTYVQIYQATPTYVTYGYYPGYMWSFPYYGVPVYGTGWYYPPYYRGPYYYPRCSTWGFHVGYNPWTGWNFGVSWTSGFFSCGVSWGGGYRYPPGRCCGGYYGGGYRRPVVINTGNVNIGNNINVGNRTNVSNRIQQSPRYASTQGGNRNLYNRPENRTRNAQPSVARQDMKQARPATNRQNNVYTDRNGNVSRKTANGWQDRSQGKWSSPQQRPSQPQRDRSDLNRAQRNRDMGAQRTQRTQRSQPRQQPQRRGGGRRR